MVSRLKLFEIQISTNYFVCQQKKRSCRINLRILFNQIICYKIFRTYFNTLSLFLFILASCFHFGIQIKKKMIIDFAIFTVFPHIATKIGCKTELNKTIRIHFTHVFLYIYIQKNPQKWVIVVQSCYFMYFSNPFYR